MRPKPDASTYYRQLSSIDKRLHAQIKAAEAREALKDKLGLPQVNSITAKSDGHSARR